MTKDSASLRQKVARDYDTIADEWDRTRQNSWGEFEFLGELLEQSHSDKNIKILDAGCGNGRLIKWLDTKLNKNGYEYLGVDSSSELLKKAQTSFPARKFQQADLTEFRAKAKYDAVACIAVLHHLPSRTDRLKVLQNLYMSLGSGGRLFLTVWNLWQLRYLKFTLKSYLVGTPRECRIPFAGRVERYVYAFTASELMQLFDEVGFSRVEVFPAARENKTGVFTGRNLIVRAIK